MNPVLVTGGSGFVGSHVILQLLAAGYRVRATLRNLKRETEVRAMLAEGGAQTADNLSFSAADLANDVGWPEAVAGCDYVLHVASPIPASAPGHEDDLIVPAREGTLGRPAMPVSGGWWSPLRAAQSTTATKNGRAVQRNRLVSAGWRFERVRQVENHCGMGRLGFYGQPSREETIVATAESLIRFGLLKPDYLRSANTTRFRRTSTVGVTLSRNWLASFIPQAV